MMGSVRKSLAESLEGLIGVPCWSVVAGRGAGSVIALDLGKKLLRRKPLRNPKLTQEQRTYEGEYQMMIYCAWRLDSPDRVICGSGDSNEEGEAMIEGLMRLIGSNITAVRLVDPALDLVVEFDQSLQLKVFCDETDTTDDNENYVFRASHRIYGIGPRGRAVVDAVEP